MRRAPEGRRRVLIRTDRGDIVVEVDAARAPVTAANFPPLRGRGLLRWRAVPPHGPAVQPARPAGQDRGRPGRHQRVARERRLPPSSSSARAPTGLRHLDGVVSMARDGPDTATSDFFICIGDQPALTRAAGATRTGRVSPLSAASWRELGSCGRSRAHPADGQHPHPAHRDPFRSPAPLTPPAHAEPSGPEGGARGELLDPEVHQLDRHDHVVALAEDAVGRAVLLIALPRRRRSCRRRPRPRTVETGSSS